MQKVTYKGWTIEYEPKPIGDRSFDWDFWHENHDGENGLCGTAATVAMAMREIDDLDEEARAEGLI